MPIIAVKNLSFSYSPENKLFSGLNFSVEKGEFVAILGENGVGKSTLLKILLGQLHPQKGTSKINGKDTKEKKDWTDVGYVPQKVTIDKQHPAKVKELVRNTDMCKHLSLDPLMNKQFHSLSGGQQQRVLVALALENNPDMLFLDEPTVGVDEKTRNQFYDLLRHFAQEHNTTIVLVTHDTELVKKYASRMLCMDANHHFKEGVCIHA